MTADLRSLGLFRICLGSVIVVDLLDRWQTLVLDYSDFGFLPRELMIRMQDYHRLAIFHLVNGQIWFLNLLFAFHALVALAFVLGYRSRVTTIVLWLLTTSLQGRNDPIGYGIDVVIRISLLWSMFLPLGARFSVDRILSRKAPVSNRYTAFPVLGLFLHVISMYAFTALLKSQSKEWMSGLGTYYALSMDEYVMPVGRILLAHPAAVKFANFSAMFIEGFGWVPLLFSWRKEWFRLPVFLVFLSMHIGMGLCLNVTLFQFGPVCCPRRSGPTPRSFRAACLRPAWLVGSGRTGSLPGKPSMSLAETRERGTRSPLFSWPFRFTGIFTLSIRQPIPSVGSSPSPSPSVLTRNGICSLRRRLTPGGLSSRLCSATAPSLISSKTADRSP